MDNFSDEIYWSIPAAIIFGIAMSISYYMGKKQQFKEEQAKIKKN